MGQRSVYDPRDPWAFRNTWTGEIRNSYDDLWIWLTLIIGIALVAALLLIPILIHRYCRSDLFCPKWFSHFDKTLGVMKQMERGRLQKLRERKEVKREYDRNMARPTAITYDVKKQLEMRGKSYHHYPDPYHDFQFETWNREPLRNKNCHKSPTHNYKHRSHSMPRNSHSFHHHHRNSRRSCSTTGRKTRERHNIPRIQMFK